MKGRGRARPAIEALLGVPVRQIENSWRYPQNRRVWRVWLRRGKWIVVDLVLGEIKAERWGMGWAPMAHPDVAKTVRDIYESGDDPGPESSEGQRRRTMEDYVAWRVKVGWWQDFGATVRRVRALQAEAQQQ